MCLNKPSMITKFEGLTNSNGEAWAVQSLRKLAQISLENIISLHTFHNNIRSAAKFEATDFIVADDDSGTPISEVIDRHKHQACIIFTTRNHMLAKGVGPTAKPACARTRAIIRTDRSIEDLPTLKRNYDILHAKYPSLDTAVKDGARVLFAARELVYINEAGDPLKVQAVDEPSPPNYSRVRMPLHSYSNQKGALSSRTLEFINNWNPNSALIWHQEFIIAVQDIAAQKYSLEECTHLLSVVTGHLTKKDHYQIGYGYKNRMNFNFRSKK